ncbi:unnamed protein product [Moneuplotes crassus]|uniref:Uncharacterized protein n=1 Tax=Euplotes crassus TaxID=5936 RepID=A0AAD1XW58_EUPCR|nr:unnamed protein product [Moneuplotes crassus]
MLHSKNGWLFLDLFCVCLCHIILFTILIFLSKHISIFFFSSVKHEMSLVVSLFPNELLEFLTCLLGQIHLFLVSFLLIVKSKYFFPDYPALRFLLVICVSTK